MRLISRNESDMSMSAPDSSTTDENDDFQAPLGSDPNNLNGGEQECHNSYTKHRHVRSDRGRDRPRRGAKGKKRGLRKPLEPSMEFKALHSQATMAFIDHHYVEAEKLALQAIQVNPEMFAAHSLLSEIHMARKDKPKALAALFNGAHTRPRDKQVWLKLAEWIIQRTGNDTTTSIRDAVYCYSRAIVVDKDCMKARRGRADLYRASGQNSRAAFDYEYLLTRLPHDTTILRTLAELYIDLNETDLARSHFDRSFRYYRANESHRSKSITWSDVNVYVELCGYEQEYQKGIFELKSLSRWLVGRGDDTLWDSFDKDDREWDREDEPRRVSVEGFRSGKYEASAYGIGLPIELRIRLGIYRLEIGPDSVDEALVSSSKRMIELVDVWLSTRCRTISAGLILIVKTMSTCLIIRICLERSRTLFVLMICFKML